MKAYALLGGPKSEWPQNLAIILRKAQAAGDLIIGVDRGNLLLEEMKIIPDLAVGDFDSLKRSELAKIEKNVADIRYSNPVKDWTDSELMLRVAFNEYQVDSLYLLGATGGRLDHFLINIFTFLNPQMRIFAPKVTILDKQNLIRFYLPGKHLIQKENSYPYFAVGNLLPVKDLTIKGARYSLSAYSGSYPRLFSSNEFLPNQNQFEFSFDEGLVILIFSKDIDRFYNLKK